MKKIFFCIFFLFLLAPAFVFADSISGYLVSKSIPLHKNLTIYGVYSGTTSENILCAFYVFDIENLDTNAAVLRLDDSHTFSDGSFYFEYQITEPQFRRGIDYNAVTKCGTTEIGAVFNVSQKEDIIGGITAEAMITDVRFFVNPENSIITVFALIIILVVVFSLAFIWKHRV